MTDGVVVRTANLARDYGRLRALVGVNLRVERGRILALLGPNGAGKTTLFKLLAGLIEPTEGEARILGRNSRDPDFRRNGSPLACLLDGHEPPRWATPRRLLALQSAASPGFDRAEFVRLLARRGLALGRPYGAFSKGQKRWILCALCLSGGEEVIALDEPAEGLDPEARRDLYDLLRRRANEREATILVATHIIHDIERVADETAILHEGRLLLHGDLEALRENVVEIETQGEAPRPGSIDNVEFLSVRQAGDATVSLARCRADARETIERVLGPEAEVRRANLETLYLGLTGGHDSSASEKETAQ